MFCLKGEGAAREGSGAARPGAQRVDLWLLLLQPFPSLPGAILREGAGQPGRQKAGAGTAARAPCVERRSRGHRTRGGIALIWFFPRRGEMSWSTRRRAENVVGRAVLLQVLDRNSAALLGDVSSRSEMLHTVEQQEFLRPMR